MGGLLLRIKSWWDGADKNQRTISIVGGGFLLLLIVATYLVASKPRMGLLASGLSGSEQGSVVQELQKLGVPYEMDVQGGVNVPADLVPELRAKLMMAGKLPASAHGGMEDFAKLGYMSTPRVEREQLKAIAESRLAGTISELDGVASAVVHLGLGEDSPFLGDKKPATASITVHEKTGGMVTREQARGIARLVASAVPGLDMSNVTVLNSRGEPMVDPDEGSSPSSKVALKLETERAEAKRREHELQSKLDQVFGPGATVANVNVELDFEAKQYTEVKRTPSKPLVITESTENMTGPNAGNAVGGAAGVTTNTGTAGAAAGASGQSNQAYSTKQKEQTFMMDERRTTGEDPAGKLKRMSISVIVDKAKVKEPAPVEEFVKSYLGPLATDTTNFTQKVTLADFDTTVATAAKAAAGSAGSKDMIQQALSILPIAALIIVAMMVIKALPKTDTLAIATADGQVIPLPYNGINVNAELVGAGAGHASLGSGSGGGGDQHHSPKAEAQRQGRSMTPEEEEEELEIEGIRRKINIPLEQIKKMADDKPEMMATLFKSWLMGDGR